MKKKFLAMVFAVIMMIPLLGVSPAQAASSYKAITKLKSGTSVDLYKDGKKEKITYQFNKAHTKVTFTINGKKFAFKTKEDYENIDAVYYGDINKKDKYVEIFVRGYGPGDTIWYVLRYDKKSLQRATMQTYDYYAKKYRKSRYFSAFDATRPRLDGKGNVKILTDGDVLYGCFTYYAKYKLDSKAFQVKETKQSMVSCGDFLVGEARKSFKAYKKQSTSSRTFTVSKYDRVKIVKASPGAGWIQIKTMSGQTGYLYRNARGDIYPGKIDPYGLIKNLPAWG